MADYSFYDVLSPMDFESLSCDLIQLRENLPFTLTRKGKDAGVDFQYKKGGCYIVGQAKKYNSYQNLLRTLKYEELRKVRRLKPSRYIITTSVSLTNSQVREVFELFEGFVVSETDILGKDELNRLLGEKKYEGVERKYTKLWIGSANVLEHVLDGVVNRRLYNLIEDELHKIRCASKYYVQNESFNEALAILEDKRYVIISGEAGAGKSTLARVLISRLFLDKYNLVVVSRDISDAWNMFDENKNQVFFFDDFLGSFQFDGHLSTGRSLSELNRFVTKIHSSHASLLIMTTREYILQQGKSLFCEQLGSDWVDLSRCIVNVSSYTRHQKAEILVNHLYYSDIELKYIRYLNHDNRLYNVINHDNYSPRMVEQFSSKVFVDVSREGNDHFYSCFIKYLDDPFAYWEVVFNRQSIASKIILLNLFISCEPIIVDALRKAFESCASVYVRKYGDMSLSPTTFEHSLRELCDTFVETVSFSGTSLVRFQNPSINDFLLEYLRGREEWIAILLEGAIYWNQLIFVFSNSLGEKWFDAFVDDDAFRSIGGRRIRLSTDCSRIWFEKACLDFDKMCLSNVYKNDFAGDLTRCNSMAEIEVSKILDVIRYFPVEDYEASREFALKRLSQIISTYFDGSKSSFMSPASLNDLPYLIEEMAPYIDYSPIDIFRAYIENIRFAKSYLYFDRFSKAYPKEYGHFIKLNIKRVRRHIRQLILEDLDWYMGDLEWVEVDEIFDFLVDELFSIYGMRMTKRFKERMEFAAYGGLSRESYLMRERKGLVNARRLEQKEKEIARQSEEREIANLFSKTFGGYEEQDALQGFKRRKNEAAGDYAARALKAFVREGPNRRDILEFLFELAFLVMRDCKDDFGRKYFLDCLADKSNIGLSRSDIISLVEPIVFEHHNRYSFANHGIQYYLFVCHLQKMDLEARQKFLVTEYPGILSGSSIWHAGYWSIWEQLNENMFIHEFVLPQWGWFVENLDFATSKSLFITFVELVDVHIELEFLGSGCKTVLSMPVIDGACVSEILDYFELYSFMDSVWLYFFVEDECRPQPYSRRDCVIAEFERNQKKLFEFVRQRHSSLERSDSREGVYSVTSEMMTKDMAFFGLLSEIGFVDEVVQSIREADAFFKQKGKGKSGR